jgi:hypothetical protein
MCGVCQPRDVASLILGEVFGGDLPALADAPRRMFPLAEFQEAGARRAADILARWGGVVIADGVGLGKTYIALALIEEELRRGGTAAVAVPAALRSAWRDPLRRLSGRYRSGVHLLSHAQLSRGSHPPALRGAVGLMVVDEAHRFRNPATRRHAALVDLCRGAGVVLITATPLNNGPQDLYYLLRLFLRDDAFVHLGVPSLNELLGTGPQPGAAIRRVLGEVMVRRSRAMLRAGPAERGSPADPIRFPHRSPPRRVRFEDPRIPDLTDEIGALELAAYAVRRDEWHPPVAIAALVRLGLLKRLESGVAALASTVGRQLGFCLAFISALEAGRLLGPGRSAASIIRHGVDPLQLVLVDLVTEPLPPGLDRGALLASTRRDMERLRRMQRLLRGPDPKLDALRHLLVSLAPEKCVVFTEFRDTAEALWRALATCLPVARIDGAGAWLGTRPAGRGAIVQRFAPRSNRAPEPPERERVRVLVATDVLSEGMNLQDARHVVSYDLPWNPVRLMQRIGRVDRLGSPHREVVPHLFLPATGLEAWLGLTRRVRAKLGDIAAAIGDEESLQLLERLDDGGAEAAEVLFGIEAREDDPMERLRIQWDALRAADGTARPRSTDAAGTRGEARSALPAVARVWSPEETDVRAVALIRHATRPWLMEILADDTVRDAGSSALHILTRALQPQQRARHPTRPVSGIEARRVARLLHAHFRVISSVEQAPPPVRANEPAARLARRLRSALAGTIPSLEPGLVSRAERVLQQLEHPMTAHAARQARRLIRELDEAPPPGVILDRVEQILSPADERAAAPGQAVAQAAAGPDRTEIVAILLTDGAGRDGPAGGLM